jgi:hypothetical protein
MAKLDLAQVISAVANRSGNYPQLLSAALQRIQDGVNNLGSQLAADPVGLASPPPPLEALNVKTAGEQVHVTLTHNAPIAKNIHYFVEYTQNDPNFLAPHVEHLGTSRGRVLNLPTKLDDGSAASYYFRAYPQLPGSKPAAPLNYGGIVPTPVTLTSTSPTSLTLQPSTGSGTAAANGEQGGWGFGKTNARGPIAPKRAIPA